MQGLHPSGMLVTNCQNLNCFLSEPLETRGEIQQCTNQAHVESYDSPDQRRSLRGPRLQACWLQQQTVKHEGGAEQVAAVLQERRRLCRLQGRGPQAYLPTSLHTPLSHPDAMSIQWKMDLQTSVMYVLLLARQSIGTETCLLLSTSLAPRMKSTPQEATAQFD